MSNRPLPEDNKPSKKSKIKKLKKKNKKLKAQLKDLQDKYSETKKDLYQIIDSPESDETKQLIEVIKKKREFSRNTYQVLMFGNVVRPITKFEGTIKVKKRNEE